MTEKEKTAVGLARFGKRQLPLEEVREKHNTLEEAKEQLNHLNERYPDLASNYVRQMLQGEAKGKAAKVDAQAGAKPGAAQAQEAQPEQQKQVGKEIPGLDKLVAKMTGSMSVEEALEALDREHGIKTDSATLARAAGVEAYAQMLRRELEQYEANFLSEEQIAELWNEADITAPGGGLWTVTAIRRLRE
jgi:hypothetical protein